MEYINVKSLEKYHPGYKDRDLKWFKCYFRMVNADPEFEMLCEIDKWRFIAFVILQLQYQKPIPIDTAYLSRKGFDFKKRSISLTLQMLQNSLDIVTEDEETRNAGVTQRREEKSKNKRETPVTEFINHWNSKETLPTIKVFSQKRIDKLNTRLKENYFSENWMLVIDKIAASRFCCGDNKRAWKADVSWMLENTDNYVKVLEGKYDGKQEVVKPEPVCAHCGGKWAGQKGRVYYCSDPECKRALFE